MRDVVRVPQAPRTWYFLGTLGFTLLATSAYVLGGLLTLAASAAFHDIPATVGYRELLGQTKWELIAQLGAFPCELGVIWLAVWLARRRFSDYLALRWPTRD